MNALNAESATAPFVDLARLHELEADDKIMEFAAFINRNAAGMPFPDYRTMDLMEIASLVKFIYVIRVEPKDGKRLLFHFSGTAFNEIYEKNVQGLYLEDFYTGDNRDTVIENNNAIIDEKRPYYFVNTAEFIQPEYEKRRKIKRLGVPCSSDGETVNFSIGLVYFDIHARDDEDLLVPL
ncbi:MAG: hypothetical protein JJ900_15600 [Rhodospirillales bacterium]|nr:hypothetical protein [Rhodospirillales bacterium]MBO6788272.1 hypothetical protein [Rhodospirillales bacterium]